MVPHARPAPLGFASSSDLDAYRAGKVDTLVIIRTPSPTFGIAVYEHDVVMMALDGVPFDRRVEPRRQVADPQAARATWQDAQMRAGGAA
jgi:hypothetical protein